MLLIDSGRSGSSLLHPDLQMVNVFEAVPGQLGFLPIISIAYCIPSLPA
jgi:hypothetical protein